jgi:hypothetical protein
MTSSNELMLHTPKDLGNGLILRRSSKADSEKIAEFNGRIHGDDDADRYRVGVWTQDMLSGNHPTMHSDEFTIVEEKKSGKIVSSMNLIPQTWSYHGIPFPVGRPEAVGTDPEFPITTGFLDMRWQSNWMQVTSDMKLKYQNFQREREKNSFLVQPQFAIFPS